MSLPKVKPQTKTRLSKAWTFTKNWVFPVLIFAFALYLSVHITMDKNHGKNTLIELKDLRQQYLDSTAAKDKRIRERDKIILRKEDTIGRWINYSIQQEKNYKKIIKNELAKNKLDRDIKIDRIDTMSVNSNLRLFERNFSPDSSQGNGN